MEEKKTADEIMEGISDVPEELEPLIETPDIAEPTEDEVE